jgi:hypothetical protein
MAKSLTSRMMIGVPGNLAEERELTTEPTYLPHPERLAGESQGTKIQQRV